MKSTSFLQILTNLMEFVTFFLVVKLMLPITSSEKETSSNFQRFLFKGFFEKKKRIETTILANNLDMNQSQRKLIY